LALARPVVSNVCCFWPRATATEGEGKIKSAAALAAALQLAGTAVFSTTAIDGEECLRAAIVNQRTTRVDVEVAVAAVEALLQ
jgi:aromatic-L-amino-acid decarboxylase